MKLAFVAVNYNNYAISTNYVSNVKSLRWYSVHDIDIVIVDNCSKNADFHRLKMSLLGEKDTLLVRSDKNLGYFGGLNFGIKQIDYTAYDYIIAGNNDLFFDRDFLRILEKKQYTEKQTVIVPDIVTLGGIHQNPQFISVPSSKRLWGYKVYYSSYPVAVIIDLLYKAKRAKRNEEKKRCLETSTEIFQCTAALMLFRKEFFDHCGLLDDSLFLWGEEVALAHQLVEAGDKMLYDPDLKVTHMENATVRRIASYKKYKLWRKSYRKYKNWYYE